MIARTRCALCAAAEQEAEEPRVVATRYLLLQDPHATKQLHQILDQDTFQRAHRLLDLARERAVNVISDEAIEFLDGSSQAKGREARPG
jgi:hypothetical protein